MPSAIISIQKLINLSSAILLEQEFEIKESMSIQSTQANFQALQEQLNCPITLEPLTHAVSLVPCAHKVQQVIAERIFGLTHGGWMVQTHLPCPVCRASVFGYMTDHFTRNVVNELNTLMENAKKNLLEKSVTVAKDINMNQPYPGQSARFVHDGGDWGWYSSGGSLRRKMDFVSVTKDSLIKQFSILGYENGDLFLIVKFAEALSTLDQYLNQFDLSQKWQVCWAKNKTQLTCLFNIIADNNEIPESHFDQIRNIIANFT